ncbi:ribonuclease T2-like [Latimeria chalumnae]|uniref:ribonuclease T2-like n=1 Tax=Latimeria chalumnae TaxID=7897 RepID=UPI0003C1A41B|nr:PREDICTED: ribonuclease Oy-like isoform X1 [Latimeria chalumnae]|eukprot:XP_005987852.1 PREDICTED: ribonuclease Oy-like isoform X1 [Latimeria chalumnae]
MAVSHTLLVLLVSGLILASREEENMYEEEEQKFCEWKCIKLVQSWPGTFCVVLQKKFICTIPETIKTWTIHGLWPNHEENCCKCWHVFPSDLEELQPDLSRYWPTLLQKSNFSFWTNEWRKHGTCAACEKSMGSPFKYFKMALKLRTVYNIDRAFSKAGVLPSCNQSYQYDSIQDALSEVMGNFSELQCVEDYKDRQVLTQIKFPLFKNLSAGCEDLSEVSNPSPYRPCTKKHPIYYYPINFQNPRDPCP